MKTIPLDLGRSMAGVVASVIFVSVTTGFMGNVAGTEQDVPAKATRDLSGVLKLDVFLVTGRETERAEPGESVIIGLSLRNSLDTDVGLVLHRYLGKGYKDRIVSGPSFYTPLDRGDPPSYHGQLLAKCNVNWLSEKGGIILSERSLTPSKVRVPAQGRTELLIECRCPPQAGRYGLQVEIDNTNVVTSLSGYNTPTREPQMVFSGKASVGGVIIGAADR